MDALRRLTAAQRRLLLALFACALFVRALVPQGWMPTTGVDGRVGLMLCSGTMSDAPMAMAMDERGDVHKQIPAHDPSSDHPCAFSGLGLAHGAPPLLALLMPPAPAFTERPLPAISVAIGHGLAAPPPPQTGPPLAV